MNKYTVCLDENINKTLIIMRGVPSSGKSTRAKELANGNEDIIFSADKFWGEDYVNNFDLTKIGLAHNFCQNNCRRAMQKQIPLVIVDNTNIKKREIIPYLKMAERYEYKLKIEEPTSEWWLNLRKLLNDKEGNKKEINKIIKFLFEKSKETHAVPIGVIERMIYSFDLNLTVESLF